MLSVTVIGEEQLKQRFQSMPGRTHNALLRTITGWALRLENYVKQEKLSGQVLNHITGKLQGSIHNDIADSPDSIVGRVYSSNAASPYNAAQEYGAIIPDRYPVNAQALHFYIGGKEIFAKFAKGFTLKERSYMRSSLAENAAAIIEDIKRAAISEAQK